MRIVEQNNAATEASLFSTLAAYWMRYADFVPWIKLKWSVRQSAVTHTLF